MRDRARTALAVLALSLGLMTAGSAGAAFAQESDLESAGEPASQTVAQLADWAVASGDNNGLPFLIIDKLSARVFVFDPAGGVLGSAPALLGLAQGDDSVPGIGDRKLSEIRAEERTTPAGRFVAGFGRARGQAKTFWVDFSTAISLHPVVTANRKEQRLKRLRSPETEDNRITYGCINVSAEFYEDVVRKTFGDVRGVVYILPDTKPLEEVFPTFRAQLRASALARNALDPVMEGAR